MNKRAQMLVATLKDLEKACVCEKEMQQYPHLENEAVRSV